MIGFDVVTQELEIIYYIKQLIYKKKGAMAHEIINLNEYDSIIHRITSSTYGSHYNIVYRDLKMLRNMYPRLIRQYLEVNNDTVLFLPFYDCIVEARKLLSKNKIDVKKFENKEESLIIMDAGRAYFGSSMDIISFIESLSNLVAETGKNGLSIFADIGPFFYYHKLNHLKKYESSLFSFFKIRTNIKAFCLCNRLDYRILLKNQNEKLLKDHAKELIVNIE